MSDTPFVTVSERARVDVTGADRTTYLEDVTTQHLVEANVGDVHGALHLDPHGAPLAMFDVVVLGDRLVLLAPDAALAESMVTTLGGRTFLLDAQFARVPAVVLAVRGSGTAEALAAIGLGYVPQRSRLVDTTLVVPIDDSADIIVDPEQADEILAALHGAGVAAGTHADLERWRIHRGVPAWESEVTAGNLPEEAGILATHVHLAKGCYPGQEAVARMWMLGRPRRRLAQVRVVTGTVTAGQQWGTGRAQVTITSVDPEGRQALAYVPATTLTGDTLDSDGAHLEVQRLIGDDTTPPGHNPSVTRRRDRATTP